MSHSRRIVAPSFRVSRLFSQCRIGLPHACVRLTLAKGGPVIRVYAAAILAPLLVVGCADKYPPCSVDVSGSSGEYVPPAPTTEPNPDPPLPPGDPGPYGADDDHGYSRSPDGTGICRCSAEDAEHNPCDVDPDAQEGTAPTSEGEKDGLCDLRFEQDPDCLPSGDAVPQTGSMCGEVFWCCVSIVCHKYWAPPQESTTVWEPGPPYTWKRMGYFFAGSKSAGFMT